jgi:uncharacterized protein YndB with AHSA1/START domain
MKNNLVATAWVTINASIDSVWEALVSPEAIKKYMFGATVITDWREGSSIVWKGEWKGKTYEDKGTILEAQRPFLLKYSHFSPKSGATDEEENYHIVTVELAGNEKRTRVTLTQDNNPTDEARQHSEKNWQSMLDELKRLVESSEYSDKKVNSWAQL